METLSLKQAADAVGKTKPTILKAIQKGKVIANKNEEGAWIVNVASLCQSYKMLPDFIQKHETGNTSQTTSSELPRTTEGNTNLTHEIIELRAKVEVLSERIQDKNDSISDLKRDKERLEVQVDKFTDTINNQTLLLTHQNENAQKPTIEPIQVKSSSNHIFTITLILIILGAGGFALYGSGKINHLFPVIETPTKIIQQPIGHVLTPSNIIPLPQEKDVLQPLDLPQAPSDK